MRNTRIEPATLSHGRIVPVAIISVAAWAFLIVSLPALAGPNDKCTCKHVSDIRKAVADFELLRGMYEREARDLEAKERPIIRN
jgi:hypothetical protein